MNKRRTHKVKSFRDDTALPAADRQATARVSRAPPFDLRRILVPVDFSICSKKALSYAEAVADRFQASLVLLHVIELYPIDYVFGLKTDDEESSRLFAQAQAELSSLGRQRRNRGRSHIETVVRLGKPYVEIVKAAKERRVQLIIMGTHGYTGLKHLQLGSAAERVVRCAPCPVLVVREPEQSQSFGL